MAITVVNTSGSPIVVTGTTDTSEKVIEPGALVAVFVKFIYWYNPTTAGHLLSLKTKDGKTIIPLRCENANESQLIPLWSSFQNIYCDDLDSGTLYIYTR